MKKKVSIKEIAQVAGVSPSTVSVVLNNKGDEFRIAGETRQKIIDTANEMGYQSAPKSKAAKTVSPNSLWCIFSPANFTQGPTTQFISGVQKYTSKFNLPIETLIFPYERGRLYQKKGWISSEFVCGAIIMAVDDDDLTFLRDNKFDIPIVLFNRTIKGYNSVSTDDYMTGQNVMAHFIKRGHTRFGLISPLYSSKSLSLRTVGFTDGFKSNFVDGSNMTMHPIAYGQDDYDGGFHAMQSLICCEPNEVPSAVFVLNDTMIAGVIHCAHRNKLVIPQDIELISYGNSDVNTLLQPSVTSYSVPSEDMSYDCAKILHNATENGILSDNINLSYAATCTFRESCPE